MKEYSTHDDETVETMPREGEFFLVEDVRMLVTRVLGYIYHDEHAPSDVEVLMNDLWDVIAVPVPEGEEKRYRIPGLDLSPEAVTAFEEGFLANCQGCKLRQIPVNTSGAAAHYRPNSSNPYACHAGEAWRGAPEFEDQRK